MCHPDFSPCRTSTLSSEAFLRFRKGEGGEEGWRGGALELIVLFSHYHNYSLFPSTRPPSFSSDWHGFYSAEGGRGRWPLAGMKVCGSPLANGRRLEAGPGVITEQMTSYIPEQRLRVSCAATLTFVLPLSSSWPFSLRLSWLLSTFRPKLNADWKLGQYVHTGWVLAIFTVRYKTIWVRFGFGWIGFYWFHLWQLISVFH